MNNNYDQMSHLMFFRLSCLFQYVYINIFITTNTIHYIQIINKYFYNM